MAEYIYQAFISYAHEDEARAGKIQQALESYPVPRPLRKAFGRRTISPIFRDRTELTAHHSLTEKILEAVETSRFLLVLCSPAAKASHWVNEEIRLFRRLHGEGAILCALLQGTPETSFPPALFEGGREPLAADLSPGNFRLGIAQLAAAILGVGLDDLIQRDLKKMRRRVTAVTLGSVTGMVAMGSLTFVAVEARKEAEQRTNDAEGQIEFMLTDLKDKLDAVGRLDALEAVGVQAAAYYDAYPLSKHDDNALGRRARVYHYLGEIQLWQGNLPAAEAHFREAYAATEELLARDPDNPDRVFEHAQSAFWVGHIRYSLNDYAAAKAFFEDYLRLCERLMELQPDADRSLQELAYATTNMGAVASGLGEMDQAQKYYERSLLLKQQRFSMIGGDRSALLSLVTSFGHLYEIHLWRGDYDRTIDTIQQGLAVFPSSVDSASFDAELALEKLGLLNALVHAQMRAGDVDAARETLSRGRRAEHQLADVAQGFVPFLYESSLLYLQQAEWEMLTTEGPASPDTIASVAERIDAFSSLDARGFEVEAVSLVYQEVMIYDSLLQDNLEEARKHLSEQQARIVNSVGDRPSNSELRLVLLIDELLAVPQAGQILADICNGDLSDLGHEARLVLSFARSPDDCPVLTEQYDAAPHIFQIAINRLGKMTKED